MLGGNAFGGMTTKQSEGAFAALCKGFRPHHTSTLNVLLHLITSPLGIYAALAALNLATQGYAGAVTAVYCLSLLPLLPLGIWAANSVAMAALAFAAAALPLTYTAAGALLAVGYVGQELAHYVSGESTFQSTYQRKSNFLLLLLEHTYFLMPLCIDAAVHVKIGERVMACFAMRSHVRWVKLAAKQELSDLSIVKEWLDAQVLPKDKTSHWWHSSLPSHVQAAFDRVAHSDAVMQSFRSQYPAGVYDIKVVPAMNEIYVAALDTRSATSDNVFYTNHVDGPWFGTPFAHLYRTIVAVNENEQIQTIFTQVPESKALTTGDVVAFDYNREVHRIALVPNASNRRQRYSLKVHYVVYPACVPIYGQLVAFLNAGYNTLARKLFVKTLAPKTLIDWVCWKGVMVATNSWYAVLQVLGGATVLNYLAACAVMHVAVRLSSYNNANVNVFLIATSFAHYLIYISTYYHRYPDTAYMCFKNRVMTFKAIALAQIAYIYCTDFTYDAVSLGMIVAGFALATAAAAALGVDRTYFGVELQQCKPQARVHTFPYNVIPHPMIVGNLIWLAGVHKMSTFRGVNAWLIPVHMGLYTLHMLQEHFDVKREGAHAPYARDTYGSSESDVAAAGDGAKVASDAAKDSPHTDAVTARAPSDTASDTHSDTSATEVAK